MSERNEITNWLAIEWPFKLKNCRALGPIISVLLTGVAILWIAISCALLIKVAASVLSSGGNPEELKINGAALVALAGFPLLIWRSVIASRQADTGREALFNEKFNAALNDLGARYQVSRITQKDGEEVVNNVWSDDQLAQARGMDRLEAFVLEREDVAPRVVRMLAAYIRAKCFLSGVAPTDASDENYRLRSDVQQAITTIGNLLDVAQRYDMQLRIDLRNCNLENVNFETGFFRGVNFAGSRLRGARMINANFQGAVFYGCDLSGTEIRSVDIRGANFNFAKYVSSPEGGVHWTWYVEKGRMSGATFAGADLSGLGHFDFSEGYDHIFATKDTVFPISSEREVDRGLIDRWATQLKLDQTDRALSERDLTEIESLKGAFYRYWSPFDASDMATGWFIEGFRDGLNMNYWPYSN